MCIFKFNDIFYVNMDIFIRVIFVTDINSILSVFTNEF